MRRRINILEFLYDELDSITDFKGKGVFKCLKCGLCCSKGFLREQKECIGIDHRGNYVKNPLTSATLFTFEKPLLEKKIKEKYNIKANFIPAQVFFMKAYKIGFISLYQLPTKENGFCYYYNDKLKECSIYEARPISCRIFPLTTINSFPTLANDCIGVAKLIGSLPKKLHVNLENPAFAPLRTIFYMENLRLNLYDFLLEEHAKIFSLLQPIFHRIDFLITRFQDYKLIDLENIINWSKLNGKYKKMIEKYKIAMKKLEINLQKRFIILKK